jgi:glycosyltransferase involved in cell wall biosynthesis
MNEVCVDFRTQKRTRLAILTTHPIPYQAPWFRALADHPALDLEVLFCQQVTPADHVQAGFGVGFQWDRPMLDGYRYQFLRNRARRPSVLTFSGLDTPDIGRLIAGEKFGAVIVNGWHYKSAWQAIQACWRTRTPLLVRGDSHLYAPRSLLRRTIRRLLYRWFVPRCDACLAAGKWSAEYFTSYGARADRVFVVPHTIAADWFVGESDRLSRARPELRSELGLEQDAVVFLFVGKFIERKRPYNFIKAVSMASRKSVRAQGRMVGDGPMRADCETLAKQSGAPIVFAGFLNQSQLVRAYVAADVLVLPSVDESWGLVVDEAMACQRPCIVSDEVGCGPDLIVPRVTGDIFPKGDVEALASLLVSYVQEGARLPAMGQAARRQSGGHSIRAAVQGVLDALGVVRSRNL